MTSHTESGASSGTLTFLFTDIVGSTRLWEEIGEARFAELLAVGARMSYDEILDCIVDSVRAPSA